MICFLVNHGKGNMASGYMVRENVAKLTHEENVYYIRVDCVRLIGSILDEELQL